MFLGLTIPDYKMTVLYTNEFSSMNMKLSLSFMILSLFMSMHWRWVLGLKLCSYRGWGNEKLSPVCHCDLSFLTPCTR